jgi:transcriptional regulator with XRE-family HTH domain
VILLSTIGSRIRKRREQLDLSQDELAKRLGFKSRSSINKIELDERNLTQSRIKAIADALETTPSYIMGWDELDEQVDLEKLIQDIQKEGEAEKIIINRYGKDVWDALCMYIQLDGEDRAEVRGMMKGLYRNDKYSIQDGLKNA